MVQETTTVNGGGGGGHMEAYHNVSKEIKAQLDVEAETVQIILTEIDNDIYSIIDACPKCISYFQQQVENEWQRFVTLVKQSQELKSVSYHKLYEILKQHQNEVYEIRAEKQARAVNLLALDEEMSKEKEIDKLMALISLSFKKIYKPTNNNLRTSSNTCRANLDNSPRTSRGTGYDNQRTVNVAGARETVGTPRDDADDDDEPEKQELEAHYMYRAQIQEVSPDVADDSGPIFDTEPLQKVHNDDDNYNVFANDRQHPEQPESINNIYPDDQGDKHIILDSLDMSTNGGEADQDAGDLD
ncbi:hypothetical protein Tco_0665401 [Tanacetum coccineum]